MSTDLTIPNAFASNTSAASAEVNENFDAIKTMVNVTGVPKVQDGIVTQSGLAADAKVPAGVMVDFAGANAPTGWLLCDGSAVSRATYADLYAALGGASSPWGQGNGSTTFNVPDLRGRIGVGADNMGGSDAGRLDEAGIANTIGTAGGNDVHTLTINEMPAHGHQDNFGSGAGAYVLPEVVAGRGIYGSPLESNPKGGGAAHNNLQPFVIVNKIVKV